MRNPDLTRYRIESHPQRIEFEVPTGTPYGELVSVAGKAFCASMRDTGIEQMPSNWAPLLRDYYQAAGITKSVYTGTASPTPPPLPGWRTLVLMTAGKDSTLKLLHQVERYGQKDVVAFYVDGLNRSEASYERDAVRRISETLGVRHVIVRCRVSGAKNRTGHWIGLRNQLVHAIAAAWAPALDGGRLADGTHHEITSETSPLWTQSRSAYRQWASITGMPVETMDMGEIEIIEEMWEQHPGFLAMTVSCYTQRNFREKQHEKTGKRFPQSWVHPTGCGICLKCLRIQGVVAMLRGDDSMLEYVMERRAKDHPNDSMLRKLHDRVHSNA